MHGLLFLSDLLLLGGNNFAHGAKKSRRRTAGKGLQQGSPMPVVKQRDEVDGKSKAWLSVELGGNKYAAEFRSCWSNEMEVEEEEERLWLALIRSLVIRRSV